MSSLRRVADASAGPTALGILVPPGPRTFLILRRARCRGILSSCARTA